jgi:tetratricopeptide (TPR) repeat protein
VKPIGTITKYYPFLDKETVDVLKALVDDALNYRDFVKRLIQTSNEYDTNTPMFLIAVIQANTIGGGYDDEIWDSIRPRCQESVVTKPWNYWSNPDIRLEQHKREFQEVMRNAISSTNDDWIRFHLFLVGAWRAWLWKNYHRMMDSASSLLEERSELTCFAPRIHYIEGFAARREGNSKAASDATEKMLRIAKEHGDILSAAIALHVRAEILRNLEPYQALSLLDECYELFQELGDITNAGIVNSSKGLVHTTLGEYDLALDFAFKDLEVTEKVLRSTGPKAYEAAIIVSALYCDLDMPEQALEWIQWVESEDMQPSRYRYFVLNKARTLIQLGRLEDGGKQLENAHKQVLLVGYDPDLAMYNHILGIYELAKGDTEAALTTLAQALVEFERLNLQLSINRCLISLAKAEIESFQESLASLITTSDSWMSRLEKHAREKDYPGIKIQHALLKAECQAMIEEKEAAILTLKDALTYSDSPGVKTLRKRINERLEELEGIPQ